jgi:hypothetical protein
MNKGDIHSAVRWGAAGGALLVAEHLGLWPLQEHLGGFARPVPYLLGVGTLGLAFTGWAHERGQGRAWTGAAIITGLGGLVTLGTYAAHAWATRPARAALLLMLGKEGAPDVGNRRPHRLGHP